MVSKKNVNIVEDYREHVSLASSMERIHLSFPKQKRLSMEVREEHGV